MHTEYRAVLTAMENWRQLHCVAALAGQRPEQKIGQVRQLWPSIEAALASGHSLKSVCASLVADGISINYKTLSAYVNRLRRASRSSGVRPRNPKDTATALPVENSALRSIGTASALQFPEDPAANLRERLNNRPGFHFNGTGRREDLI
jgi:hypothetical protein